MLQRVLPSLSALIRRKPESITPLEERRVWVRYPCRAETKLHPAKDSTAEPIPARVHDVSRGGIQLLVEDPMNVGDMVSIDLPGDGSPGPATVLACILEVRAESDNEWAVSCEFSAELSEGELAQFGVKSPPMSGAEQRAAIRYAGKAQASFEVIGGGSTDRGLGRVLDLSASGVGLAVAHPIAVGTLLNIDLCDGNDRRVGTMLASVVRTRPALDGGSILGCNFVGELNENQVRDLIYVPG